MNQGWCRLNTSRAHRKLFFRQFLFYRLKMEEAILLQKQKDFCRRICSLHFSAVHKIFRGESGALLRHLMAGFLFLSAEPASRKQRRNLQVLL